MTAPTCSFCGLERRGGVAGPTPAVYICPDCIKLARQLLEPAEPQTPDPSPAAEGGAPGSFPEPPAGGGSSADRAT
ncbi:MAG: ClpX C4-type zinc finger protein [Acidimicrobiales bacterium]